MNKCEDKNICAECGGVCCIKSGCDYFVSDFKSLKFNYLDNVLKGGYVSIIASLDFERTTGGKLIINPILSLRARNRNREIIDLLSMKTTCLSLSENGCRYSLEERPSGGATLIPKENMNCYSEVNRLEELQKWIPHQKTLQKLVKKYTGKNIYDKLREDVQKLFYDILAQNFKDVSILELTDIQNMIPLLVKVYPKEYQIALSMSSSKKCVKIK